MQLGLGCRKQSVGWRFFNLTTIKHSQWCLSVCTAEIKLCKYVTIVEGQPGSSPSYQPLRSSWARARKYLVRFMERMLFYRYFLERLEPSRLVNRLWTLATIYLAQSGNHGGRARAHARTRVYIGGYVGICQSVSGQPLDNELVETVSAVRYGDNPRPRVLQWIRCGVNQCIKYNIRKTI